MGKITAVIDRWPEEVETAAWVPAGVGLQVRHIEEHSKASVIWRTVEGARELEDKTSRD